MVLKYLAYLVDIECNGFMKTKGIGYEYKKDKRESPISVVFISIADNVLSFFDASK